MASLAVAEEVAVAEVEEPVNMIVKKIITAGVIVIVAFFLYSVVLEKTYYRAFKITNYQIENRSYKLLVADTPDLWERGLMNFRSLPGVDGMIFLFPDSKPRTFWNKNTFMDLNLVWINENKVIGTVQLPSIEKSKEYVYVASPGKADKVLELKKK